MVFDPVTGFDCDMFLIDYRQVVEGWVSEYFGCKPPRCRAATLPLTARGQLSRYSALLLADSQPMAVALNPS